MELMFLPGLSTKDEVTNVSGRGVGMDVVRTNLNQVGGSIEVTSEPGRGSVFRLNVPLTLAIMPIAAVWSGGERYAIPQVDVQEVVHLDRRCGARSVDDLDGARLHRLRDRLLPLVDLADQLGVTAAATPAGELMVVVVEIAGKRFGLVVDAIGDTTEVVVEPLTRATRSIAVFGGVTILADGRPTLILDLSALAAAAGVVGVHDDAHARSRSPTMSWTSRACSSRPGSTGATSPSHSRRCGASSGSPASSFSGAARSTSSSTATRSCPCCAWTSSFPTPARPAIARPTRPPGTSRRSCASPRAARSGWSSNASTTSSPSPPSRRSRRAGGA